MRILHICAAYKPAYVYGGPTMSVSMLSEQLVGGGVSTEVYATTANGKTELAVRAGETVMVDGVPVTYFKRLTKDHSHFSPALMKRVWQQARTFDAVHIHAWWNLVSILACATALLRKVPVVLSPRGTLSPYSFQNKSTGIKWLIHHLLGKPLLKRCHFHATSGREAEAVGRIITPKSIVTLPNFVQLPTVVHQHKTSQVFRLLFFSRIEEKKGLNILLNTLPLLHFSYTLTIAGDGDDAYVCSLKNLAIENGVSANVTWAGFRSADKFHLLAAHDLLVLPSHDENFGNVVIESLSQGTAVAVSGHVGLAGYVTGNALGWEFEPSAEALSQKLNFISGQQQELDRIRMEAPALIRRDFNGPALVKQYTDMYKRVIYGGL